MCFWRDTRTERHATGGLPNTSPPCSMATQRLHMSSVPTDRIEKTIVLRAPRARVWRALTDPAEFARWFGVKFDAPFKPGAPMRGVLVGTAVDAAVAKAQRQHADVPFEITIDRIEPE